MVFAVLPDVNLRDTSPYPVALSVVQHAQAAKVDVP
jgi:hypothetical protein